MRLGAEESQRGGLQVQGSPRCLSWHKAKLAAPATTDSDVSFSPPSTTQLTKGANEDKESPRHLDKQQSPVFSMPSEGKQQYCKRCDGQVHVRAFRACRTSHLLGKEGAKEESTCPRYTTVMQIIP